MRRLRLRLATALVTFVIGVAAASLWLTPHQSSSNRAKVSGNGAAPAPAKTGKTVLYGMAGRGMTEDGYGTSFVDEEYSDGTSLHQSSVYYKSQKRANAELRKRLKEAVEIIRRKPVLDEWGRQVGEAIVATFAPHKGSSAVRAELLWTEGSKYAKQTRSSLDEVLEAWDSKR